MKCFIRAMNVSAMPMSLEIDVYKKPVADSEGTIILSADMELVTTLAFETRAHPGQHVEARFEWPLPEPPESYKLVPGAGQSGKWQLRRFTCDGRSVVYGADTEGNLPHNGGLFV